MTTGREEMRFFKLRQQSGGDRQAEVLRRPEIDDQLQLGWKLHTQISGDKVAAALR